MSFHETRFPTSIAFQSSGGPERKTEIVTLGSGFEERNAVWANSRRRYDVGYGVRTLDGMHHVTAFFEARMGRLHGFRFRDFADYKSCAPGQIHTPLDQLLGTGDGATTDFPLRKSYSGWSRRIHKPLLARVALNGVESTDFTLDTLNGLIQFNTPPAAGAVITAGYEFDTPVRFDTDSLSINLAGFQAGEIPSIPLVEIAL